MTYRLPLPLKTITEIKSIICSSDSLLVKNPLQNALEDICNYDYLDAIKILSFMQEDYPNLIDYRKHIAFINAAKKRYDKLLNYGLLN